MTAWRITLVEQPPRAWTPGRAKPPEGLWDFVAEEPGMFLVGPSGGLRQDVRRFEGTGESRDAALAKAQHAIDKELARRERYEVVYYPPEPEETTE